jgi:hypothetical protein
MCSQFFQSCMISHEHCRFSLLSFSVVIENVDFCDWDWDCDWFWRMITLTYSIIFNFFLTTYLNSRIVSSKWTFFSIAFFCIIQLSQNVEVHFRSAIKNFRRTSSRNRRNSWYWKSKFDFWDFFNSLLKFQSDSWMTIASMFEIFRVFISWFDRRFSCI